MEKQNKSQQKHSGKDHSPEEKIQNLLQIVLICLALLFLTSCGTYLPQAQEMGNMALLRSFAVDKEENYLVTVSTGQQVKGMSQEDALILQGEGQTLQGACENINRFTEDYVFYGYVDQLLLGRDMASSGVEKVLEYFATQKELSLGTALWLVYGSASQLMSSATEEGTAEHLQTLREESPLGISGISRTVGEVYGDILELGASYVPMIHSSPDWVLEEIGYGILYGDCLVDIFQGDLAQGLELWLSHPQLVELSLEEGAYALQLEEFSWEIQEDTQGKVQAMLEIQAELVEQPQNPRENILPHLEAQLKTLCDLSLQRLQQQEADVIALGLQLNHSQEDWPSIFPTLEIDTTVTVALRSG